MLELNDIDFNSIFLKSSSFSKKTAELLTKVGGSSSSGGEPYSRTYTWNEKNLLIASSDSNCSTSYVYGSDGQRSNKYTYNSETIYFNKMWTLRTDSGISSSGGQTSKNIYLGDTRIVTKLNSGNDGIYSEELHKQYYYHSDHLGSASLISDWEGYEYQRLEYTPYGELWVEKTSNTGSEYLPYKFTGKEMDSETGLYYYGARYLDPKYSRWISTDPALGEYIPQAGGDNSKLPSGGLYNTSSFNLFNYSNNNPIKYTDPDGRNPVYDLDGNLIGVTENSGLQGDALIMNKEDFDPKMSLDDAKKKNMGIDGLNGKEAQEKFNKSFSGLKDRPDWDGKLTLEEANEWYRNGSGKELFVDINQIDLSMLYSLGDDYVGKKYRFNLQVCGSKDGLVYGSITFMRYPNNTCRAYSDIYDFDMKSGIKNIVRNIATKCGSIYAGKGTSYAINIYGSHQLEKR